MNQQIRPKTVLHGVVLPSRADQLSGGHFARYVRHSVVLYSTLPYRNLLFRTVRQHRTVSPVPHGVVPFCPIFRRHKDATESTAPYVSFRTAQRSGVLHRTSRPIGRLAPQGTFLSHRSLLHRIVPCRFAPAAVVAYRPECMGQLVVPYRTVLPKGRFAPHRTVPCPSALPSQTESHEPMRKTSATVPQIVTKWSFDRIHTKSK